MAAPATTTVGQVLTSAFWNTEVRDQLNALRAIDYLVGTASADLSAEVVAGAAPGGELGGTWASPTVDSVHSGSAHASLISDTAYGAGWNGVTTIAPSKNAVYDKIEALSLTFTEHFVIRKTADETVNNSATLQDDDDFTFAIGASETWVVDIYIQFDFAANVDFRQGWTLPSGGTSLSQIVWWTTDGASFGGKQAVAQDTDLNNGYAGGIGVDHTMQIHAVLINSTTPGNATFQWAHGSAHASDLTFRINSYMVAHRLA